jgi:membrane-bound lytic murein transglycosylase D
VFKKIIPFSDQFAILLMAVSILFFSTTYAAPSPEGIQIYQKNLHISLEHKQKLADDISRYRHADNLWDVLREDFTLAHYESNPAVQDKIQWYMNNQDFLLRSASRAAPYLYYIKQQVKKRHLPAELVLLPIVESGYNPFSLSNVGAAGIWQLMPGTATGLGVKRDWWYDGRRDVIASTHAALNYLAYLQSFFDGNWLLAIAAYNTGEGNILSAIRRNIKNGRDTDFWSLPVAQETRDYVPSILALAVIISHPNRYPIYFPPVRNAPYLAQVDVGTQINIKYAARLAGISYKKMLQLNPGFNRPSTSKQGPYKVVLPIENVEQFTESLARIPLNKRPINWIHYHVKPGDTFASISKKFNTNIAAIKKLNRLGKNNLHRGTDLLIPNVSHTQLASSVSANTASKHYRNNKYALQAGDTIYIVKAGDTLASVAKRFHVTNKALKVANALEDGILKQSRQIIIPTHAKTQAAHLASTQKLQAGDTIYMVRHGDTIEKIANRFRTTAAAIRITNLIDNNSLAEGEKIVIPTRLRS